MKAKYIIFICALCIMISGCEDLLFDNKNPDKASKITPELGLPVLIFYSAQTNYDHAEYGIYLSQALTTGGRSQEGAYGYKSGWQLLTMNRHPQWRRHFYDIGANAEEVMKAAEESGAKNVILIARTIRLMSTQLTTDVFGDMPLTEAYKSNSPKYDTQESIYQWMLQEADELIGLYNNPQWRDAVSNVSITTKMDRIYSGDLNKWKQFTIALKARILLRKLPNWENTPAVCDLIINTVDAVLADWTEPTYTYDNKGGTSNCPWGPSQPIINSWESRGNLLDKAIVSKYFCKNIMGVYDNYHAQNGASEDPRLEKMMTRRAGPVSDPSPRFRYLENNIGMPLTYQEKNYPDLFSGPYAKNDGYIPLMTKEELLLMKAEATYWKGDKISARELTIEAAQISMDRFKVTNVRAKTYYFTGTYKEKYFPEGTAFTIGHVMRQKYVCMYMQPEQWNDMRRYCYSNNNNLTYDGAVVYPDLRRPYNLYEPYWMRDKNPDGTTKEVWIQRINYDPETEEKYNRPELERLGAFRSADWLKKPMIWAIYTDARK